MFGLPRILAVYAIAIPLALVLGYILSTPDTTGFAFIGLVLLVLVLPILLQWHHILLIFFWNSAFNFPFLPAQPHFWLLLAALSFGISWLNGLLGQSKFLRVPELTKPLIFLGLVVLITGYVRGGIGSRVLGGAAYGGRNYIYVVSAIIGYFALSAVRIPVAKASRSVGVYFLSGVTFILPNIAFALGPAFYFLFFLLPGEFAASQATAASGIDPGAVERFAGIAPACTALVCYFLVRWGIRGLFALDKPWRLGLLCVTLVASFFAGFRGMTITLAVLFLCQFFCEGLYRTRFLPVAIALGLCACLGLVAFSARLPLTAQRALSYLPVKVDATIRAEAEGSTEWRLEMWRVLWSQIPKYLLIGKGYSLDPEELYLSNMAGLRGETTIAAEASMVAGDYHSGFFSIIIPFGIWGVIGLLWLFGAGVKALYQNYRYGDPALHHINTFLLAFFITQIIVYFAVFGAFNSQLYLFTGTLGLSVALNGGVRKARRALARPALRASEEAPVPVAA